jgi:glycosyltransferase involved in cell wall biosynthesis
MPERKGEALVDSQDAAGLAKGRQMRVSIVLPAYNEEENIERAIAEATRTAERLFGDHEVIVVDDGSSDDTVARVRRVVDADQRVRLICHGRNRGYGEALRTGFLSRRLDYLFFTDADLQFEMDELEGFLPYVGAVDVIVGFRRDRQDPWGRKLSAWVWNRIMRLLFYVPVRDIDCAFKLFDGRVLNELDIESVGLLVNTELMVKLGRSGYSLVEVGVTHKPRPAGESSFARPSVVVKALLEVRRMRRRLSSFEPPQR